MSEMKSDDLDQYYQGAATWSADRASADAFSRRAAWIVAAVAVAIAAIEGISLMLLLPLKTVVPYTLLVDRQTGNVQALRPLDKQDITPDDALVRSLLAQYVMAREGFDITTLRADYRKVALWSGGEARDRYLALMQANNPISPLATLPRQTIVSAEVVSISSLNADTALVRFVASRVDPGARPALPQHWVAVIKYQFSGAAMSEADRLFNPLGFQVLRYRRSAESVPLPSPPNSPGPPPTAQGGIQ